MTVASESDAAPRRFQVEDCSSWWGWCVRERGKRRIAVFFRRGEARAYARLLNERDGALNERSERGA